MARLRHWLLSTLPARSIRRGDCSPDTPGAGARHDAIRERIKSRAVRVSNRDRDAEARYLARHEPLIKGR